MSKQVNIEEALRLVKALVSKITSAGFDSAAPEREALGRWKDANAADMLYELVELRKELETLRKEKGAKDALPGL